MPRATPGSSPTATCERVARQGMTMPNEVEFESAMVGPAPELKSAVVTDSPRGFADLGARA